MTQTMVERVDWEAAERALEEDAVSSDRALATLFARHRLKAIEATGVVELRSALEGLRAAYLEKNGCYPLPYQKDGHYAEMEAADAALTLTQLAKGSE